MTDNWKERFLQLADTVAGWSKDKSTKVGAVIVDDDNRVLSIGYNGFPVGVNDEENSRHERPIKYLYTEHGERNAIYSAARNGIALKGSAIILRWYPCADCARAIIQSGIKTVICDEPDFNQAVWGEQFKVSHDMFIESGVIVNYIDEE